MNEIVLLIAHAPFVYLLTASGGDMKLPHNYSTSFASKSAGAFWLEDLGM